jgi:hypothetical protein
MPHMQLVRRSSYTGGSPGSGTRPSSETVLPRRRFWASRLAGMREGTINRQLPLLAAMTVPWESSTKAGRS